MGRVVITRNAEEILAMRIGLGKKFWKGAEAMKKSIHELKTEFLYLCMSERKNINSFEINVIKNA